MRIHATLLPFSTAQFATLDGNPASSFAAVATPQIIAAGGTPQLPVSEQAAFAGLLALAVNPKEAAESEPADDAAPSDASSDDAKLDGTKATDTKVVAVNPDTSAPITTGSDLTNIASTLSASMIVRDLGALQPQFRAKVERVISRMNDEYGHTVSVAETYRSQTRQNQLLQQGRTTAGPIVTWTSHSLHTQGRAADLIVDGKWNNPEGFQHLQEIATQEGLTTLGSRDPGHVEMREDPLATITSMAQITEVAVAKPSAPVAATIPAAPVVSTPQQVKNAPVALVAQVAPVAHVAQVAKVAQVARVAQPAQPAPAISTAPANSSSTDSNSGRRDKREQSADSDTPQPVTAAPKQPATVPSTSTAPISPSTSHTAAPLQPAIVAASPASAIGTAVDTTVGSTSPVTDVSAAARAVAILAMQDAKNAQPVSHMTLQLDNGSGGLDRIRVGLRGTTVGATIDMHDSGAATQAADNIHQLATALQSRGLDTDSLQVRVAATAATAATAPASEISRVLAASGDTAAPALGTLFAQASSSSSRSRGDAQGQRPQQDPSRQRARKDHQGEQQ